MLHLSRQAYSDARNMKTWYDNNHNKTQLNENNKTKGNLSTLILSKFKEVSL